MGASHAARLSCSEVAPRVYTMWRLDVQQSANAWGFVRGNRARSPKSTKPSGLRYKNLYAMEILPCESPNHPGTDQTEPFSFRTRPAGYSLFGRSQVCAWFTRQRSALPPVPAPAPAFAFLPPPKVGSYAQWSGVRTRMNALPSRTRTRQGTQEHRVACKAPDGRRPAGTCCPAGRGQHNTAPRGRQLVPVRTCPTEFASAFGMHVISCPMSRALMGNWGYRGSMPQCELLGVQVAQIVGRSCMLHRHPGWTNAVSIHARGVTATTMPRDCKGRACNCSFANGMWRSFDQLGSNWVLVPGTGSCRLHNLVNRRATVAAADAGNLTTTPGKKLGGCRV